MLPHWFRRWHRLRLLIGNIHVRKDVDALYSSHPRCRSFSRWPMGRSCKRVSRTRHGCRKTLLICYSELTIKVVNMADSYRVLYLREQPKPPKHLSFDPSGAYIAVSCADGIVYIYSLSTEEPALVRKVDGLIRSLEIESETTSCAIWHPDGRAFAAPTATRDIQVVSSTDGERQRAFSGGHMGDITALAWSPNGALLLSAGVDRKIILWDTKSQKILARWLYSSRVTRVALFTDAHQIRLPKCNQCGMASPRKYCLIRDLGGRIVHLRQFLTIRCNSAPRKDSTTLSLHSRSIGRDEWEFSQAYRPRS